MNNEAILNKLIELGQLTEDAINPNYYFDHIDKNVSGAKNNFDPLYIGDFAVIQRALFDVCGDKYDLLIRGNILTIFERNKMQYEEDPDAIIHQGDTSRESFKAAFEKVVGVSCE